ncbi:MAG: hypothetical protein COA69_06465 [Robiginitomaculum sp.]|nr:MAG: hypothetical protein COA69_06465 [Robiginitomaculum sp.]
MKTVSKVILVLVGLGYLLNAAAMWFAPQYWYESVPGVSMMGPFNLHFIRDISFIYVLAGIGLIYGLRTASIAVYAAIWPAAHAVYHIVIFFDRGAPMDNVALANVLLIQMPAWASLGAALYMGAQTTKSKSTS